MSRTLLLPDTDPLDLALAGFARANRDRVRLNPDPAYLTGLRRHRRRRVGLVSGGGSGHEPLHAGFIGVGLLDAAAPGRIFASPHNRQVYEAGLAVAGEDGVLQVVKNYTGDRINFGIAAERLRDRGLRVARVLVDDDVATENEDVATGRRGTAATLIVEKVLGGAADDGLGLDELVEVGERVVARSRTVAVATRAQTSASEGDEAFELRADEVEYGVGIHGERAATSIDRPPLEELVGRMVDDVLEHLEDRDGHRVLLVNSMGAATNLELQAVGELAARRLEAADCAADDLMIGTFVPALDMSGVSITVAVLDDDAWGWWRGPADSPAWTQGSLSEDQLVSRETTEASAEDAADAASGQASAGGDDVARRTLEALDPASRELHGLLTRYDQQAGDGDFGDNFREAFTRVGRRLGEAGQDVSAYRIAAEVFLDDVGGTSGPLLGLLFQALAAAAEEQDDRYAVFAAGLREGTEAVQRVGEAEVGDRTMVDTLVPVAEALGSQRSPAEVAEAARDAAHATAELTARQGRSSYLGERALGVPDPGSIGIAAICWAWARAMDADAVPADVTGFVTLPDEGAGQG